MKGERAKTRSDIRNMNERERGQFKAQIIRKLRGGATVKETSRELGCSETYVRDLWNGDRVSYTEICINCGCAFSYRTLALAPLRMLRCHLCAAKMWEAQRESEAWERFQRERCGHAGVS